MRLLLTGSSDKAKIYDELDFAEHYVGIKSIFEGGTISLNAVADQWAHEHGIPAQPFNGDWSCVDELWEFSGHASDTLIEQAQSAYVTVRQIF